MVTAVEMAKKKEVWKEIPMQSALWPSKRPVCLWGINKIRIQWLWLCLIAAWLCTDKLMATVQKYFWENGSPVALFPNFSWRKTDRCASLGEGTLGMYYLSVTRRSKAKGFFAKISKCQANTSDVSHSITRPREQLEFEYIHINKKYIVSWLISHLLRAIYCVVRFELDHLLQLIRTRAETVMEDAEYSNCIS